MNGLWKGMITWFSAVALAVLLVFAAIPSPNTNTENDKIVVVSVESVELSQNSVSLEEGKYCDLSYDVFPRNATRKTVVWSSSNPEVATVEGGRVKAIKAGNAVIAVSSLDGAKTAFCSVNVISEINPSPFVFTERTDHCILTRYRGDEAEVIIPEMYNNKPIVKIGESAFAYLPYLEKVTLSSAVKDISERAFAGCTWLTEINLGAVERIGKQAFANCGLQELDVPTSVVYLGTETFAGCKDLVIVRFASTSGWLVYRSEGEEKTPLSVNLDDPILSATAVKETFAQFIWAKGN